MLIYEKWNQKRPSVHGSQQKDYGFRKYKDKQHNN
jgi:hypothetical protein